LSKNVLCLAQVVFSYFVLHRSKIPLVFTTKVTHLRSLLFRQQDGVNSVIQWCRTVSLLPAALRLFLWITAASQLKMFLRRFYSAFTHWA